VDFEIYEDELSLEAAIEFIQSKCRPLMWGNAVPVCTMDAREHILTSDALDGELHFALRQRDVTEIINIAKTLRHLSQVLSHKEYSDLLLLVLPDLINMPGQCEIKWRTQPSSENQPLMGLFPTSVAITCASSN